MLGRISAVLAGLGIAATLVLVTPIAAGAAYPDVPSPVNGLPSVEMPDPNNVLTPEEALLRKYEIQMGRPGLLTRAANFVRTPGNALFSGALAWSITGAGMKTIMTGTGADWDQQQCADHPAWNAVYSVLTLGTGSANCTWGISTANGDQTGAYYLPLTTPSGSSLQIYGTTGYSTGVIHCVQPWGDRAGYNIQGHSPVNGWQNVNGEWPQTPQYYGGGCYGAAVFGTVAWECPGCEYGNGPTVYGSIPDQPTLGYNGFRIVRISDGAVISQSLALSPDPTRWTRCTIELATGGTLQSDPVSYHESSGYPLSAMADSCARKYEGANLKPSDVAGVSVGTRTGESSTGSYTEIADSPVPSEYQEVIELYPDCYDGSTRCDLILTRTVDGDTKNCFTSPAKCAGWFAATLNATTTMGTDGAEYECMFGRYVVDLAECSLYREAFVNPSVSTTPGRILDPGGQPLPNVGSNSDTGTNNSIDPSTGVGTGPDNARCMDSWFDDLNPIDWVLVPVKCALQWAFVPRTSAVTGTVTALAESAGDVAAVDPLLGVIEMLPSSGGCGGIPITLTFFGQSAHGTLLYACDGFGATAAAVVNGLLTLAVATGAVLAVVRYAAAVFGFVGPGGSMEQTQYIAAQRAARND